jgi:aminoglycoside phosphotransferase (APT) family kinase protein
MGDSEDMKFTLAARRAFPGSKLLRVWELEGGVSARVTALEVELPEGGTKKMVVRRHGAADGGRNPRIAEDEFRLLGILQAEGVPAPSPYYVDRAGEIFGTPCVIVEYIVGATEFEPADVEWTVSQLVGELLRIHGVTPGRVDLSFLPGQDEMYARKIGQRPARLDESLDEGWIRDALEAGWPPGRRNADALLHGDYWPGNTLWRGGRLVGIIDWEDAHVGDPLEDVANSRLEILWAFGVEAVQSFTRQYEAGTSVDLRDLAYWDLCAAIRPAHKISEWAGGEARERAMREGHRWFVGQAFERLAL